MTKNQLYFSSLSSYMWILKISDYFKIFCFFLFCFPVSPTIHEVLGPSRVQWKQNISFSCKLDGVPTPRVIWFKDMSKIPYTSRIYARGNELHIISSENGDTGNYTCEASNVVGSAKMTRQLIVEGG